MQGVNNSPITGILGMVYSPETAAESFFQLPTIFDFAGALQIENPVGSGKMGELQYGLFTPPAQSHMIGVQPYNLGWMAFSNLKTPTSQMAVFNPKTRNLDPYGQKPFGWLWLANTQVLVGEMACPSAQFAQGGNGHTYRCVQAGTTAAFEPAWPTTENGLVEDGTVQWEEYTAVMANRLPSPGAPVLTRASGGGAFAAGRDVYVILTYLNAMGETIAGPPSVLSNTVLDDAVTVGAIDPEDTPGWVRGLPSAYFVAGIRIYEADVAHGDPAPPETSYQYVATMVFSTPYNITGSATSAVYAPTINTARITPGQLPTPNIGPTIQRVSTAGTFPAGRDVYVLQTYLNDAGETPAGPANSIINTELDDAVQVTVAAPQDYPQITQINIYECDVPTASPAPNSTQFALVGTYAPGATPSITSAATGPPPPIVNGTGPAGNIAADNPTGGINGSQGYRYAAIMFENRNFSVSGFTQSSVIQYDVDEDGWEISVFNVAPGPGNVIARIVAFTVADSSSAGPFNYNGNINPQIPSQNFVYPQTFPSDGVAQSSTVFYDNVTTQGTFNFTDTYLIASNDVTDRLRIIWPNQCVHIAYCPSVDRMFQTGIYGYWSACAVSNAAAPEDYYGDTCYVTVESDDGQRAWGVIEYRQQIYLMRERSGFVISANPNNANEWVARSRWDQVGACGPRAFDACDKFMIFVHRSGIYKYESDVDLMSKEIPYWWQTINWAAAETICVKIDYETHQVQILVPVNGSPVPNQKVMLNFGEGWANPIHFSTYSGKEISMDAARKYSIDDMAAFVCTRIERALPAPPQPVVGDDDVPLTSSSFQVSQFVYGSSGPDGTVQASVPGIFDDNGNGIDWQYETVCPQQAMAVSQIEGFVLNARGNGKIPWWILGARKSAYGQTSGSKQPLVIQGKRPIDLNIEQGQGISRTVPPKLNEKWRLRFTNGKQAGTWASLKWAAIYVVPMYSGRTEGKSG